MKYKNLFVMPCTSSIQFLQISAIDIIEKQLTCSFQGSEKILITAFRKPNCTTIYQEAKAVESQNLTANMFVQPQ